MRSEPRRLPSVEATNDLRCAFLVDRDADQFPIAVHDLPVAPAVPLHVVLLCPEGPLSLFLSGLQARNAAADEVAKEKTDVAVATGQRPMAAVAGWSFRGDHASLLSTRTVPGRDIPYRQWDHCWISSSVRRIVRKRVRSPQFV